MAKKTLSIKALKTLKDDPEIKKIVGNDIINNDEKFKELLKNLGYGIVEGERLKQVKDKANGSSSRAKGQANVTREDAVNMYNRAFEALRNAVKAEMEPDVAAAQALFDKKAAEFRAQYGDAAKLPIDISDYLPDSEPYYRKLNENNGFMRQFFANELKNHGFTIPGIEALDELIKKGSIGKEEGDIRDYIQREASKTGKKPGPKDATLGQGIAKVLGGLRKSKGILKDLNGNIVYDEHGMPKQDGGQGALIQRTETAPYSVWYVEPGKDKLRGDVLKVYNTLNPHAATEEWKAMSAKEQGDAKALDPYGYYAKRGHRPVQVITVDPRHDPYDDKELLYYGDKIIQVAPNENRTDFGYVDPDKRIRFGSVKPYEGFAFSGVTNKVAPENLFKAMQEFNYGVRKNDPQGIILDLDKHPEIKPEDLNTYDELLAARAALRKTGNANVETAEKKTAGWKKKDAKEAMRNITGSNGLSVKEKFNPETGEVISRSSGGKTTWNKNGEQIRKVTTFSPGENDSWNQDKDPAELNLEQAAELDRRMDKWRDERATKKQSSDNNSSVTLPNGLVMNRGDFVSKMGIYNTYGPDAFKGLANGNQIVEGLQAFNNSKMLGLSGDKTGPSEEALAKSKFAKQILNESKQKAPVLRKKDEANVGRFANAVSGLPGEVK